MERINTSGCYSDQLNARAAESISLYSHTKLGYLDYQQKIEQRIANLNEAEMKRLDAWLDWIDQVFIDDSYRSREVVLGIRQLDNELVDDLVTLDPSTLEPSLKHNLRLLIETDNPYGVNNRQDLVNYAAVIESRTNQYLHSEDYHEVKMAAMNLLSFNFNDWLEFSAIQRMDKAYLPELQEQGVIDHFDNLFLQIAATITQARSLADFRQIQTKDWQLRQINGLGIIMDKIRQNINQLYEQQLFRPSGEAEFWIKYQNQDIPVYVLNNSDQPFKILSHSVSGLDFEEISERLIEQPNVWNSAQGASTLSTSLISSDKLIFFDDASHSETLFYGFADLNNSIIFMGPQDVGTEPTIGSLQPSRSSVYPMMTPDQLLSRTVGKYNEVVLWRYSSLNQKELAGRLQPSYMIVYGQSEADINEASKKAAVYFKAPIVLIDKSAY